MPHCNTCHKFVNDPEKECKEDECPHQEDEQIDLIGDPFGDNENNEVAYSQVYHETPLSVVWDAVCKCKCEPLSLESWRKNPQNGYLFLHCLRDARVPKWNTTLSSWKSAKRSTRKFLGIIKKAKLEFNCSALPSCGYWSYGFMTGQLDDTVVALVQMVSFTLRQLDAPDETTLALIKAYFSGGIGDIPMLKQIFTDLLGALKTGGVRGKTIIICKGTTIPGERTCGYVLENETPFLGQCLTSQFRCIFLTEACLNGKDSQFETVDPKWFRATTILHELTHLCLGAKDLKTSGGKEAYGRKLCVVLALQHGYKQSRENDPFDNADTIAYFACDLLLIKKLVPEEELFNVLSTNK